MRLFLAIELPEATRRHLLEAVDLLRPAWANVRWVKPDNLHLTLKFLGEVSEGAVAPLCEALRNVPSKAQLHLQPDHVELLPPRGSVRVIAAGVGGDVESLGALANDIETACAA